MKGTKTGGPHEGALPWTRVRAELRAPDVAEWLGLRPARERHKWGCPVCGGSDPLHSYPEPGAGFFCWGGCGRAYTVIDLAAAALGIEPAESCRQLAQSFGITADTWSGKQRPKQRRGRGSISAPARPGIGRPGRSCAAESSPGPTPEALKGRSEVYSAFQHYARLTDRGAAYLAGRGLDPGAAEVYGFRSLDGLDCWREVYRQLERFYPASRLADVGLDPPPFSGRGPALLIPYYGLDLCLDAIRFRNLGTGEPKYRTLAGNSPTVPFNAPALAKLTDGGELHVTEGELDAFTLRTLGLPVIGLPGTGFTWRREWTTRYLARAGRLVMWPDPDPAGDKAAKRFAGEIQATLGASWLTEHGRLVDLGTADVNDTLKQGALNGIIEAAEWRG